MAVVLPLPIEQDDAEEGRGGRRGCRVAVIGAGFSGALVAIHLLWRCRPGERVYLVERNDAVGQGLAYGTPNPHHLVNIRVENMSAFADEPAHFTRWLAALPPARREAAISTGPGGSFVQRGVYGQYIRQLLTDSITRLGGARHIYMVPDEAVAVRPLGQSLVLETAIGRVQEVDAVVLALGNRPPDPRREPGYFGNPWDAAATADLLPDLPVLLIGTGLTMIDVVLDLLERGFEGPILALSRRGLLPQAHDNAVPWPGLRLHAEDRRSLVTLTRAVRREVRRAAAEGRDWRAVIDALRPHVRLLWQELRVADRQRFIRHLRPWWDSHRHRAAPSVAARLAAAIAAGQLRICAGRLLARQAMADHRIDVSWLPRGATVPTRSTVQRVINCSGPGTDLAQAEDLLIRQLVGDGVARPDACRLGLDVTPFGAVVQRSGVASDRLFAVGPITRGAFWEITSVADIRDQAEQVAISALDAARRAAPAA